MTAKTRKAPTVHRGVVVSKSGNKTVRVVLQYQVEHRKYGKILKRRTTAHVHDENNLAKIADAVEICKCRSLSKSKNWRLLRVISETGDTAKA